MADVFISYKRDERDRAERISRRLKALGLDVWLDARIPSGVAFDAEIETALKTAKAVLVLWTPGSVASEWVRNEASVGKDRGVLIALMLAPCELPIAFRSVQYEPLFDANFHDDHPGWIKVLERIKDLVGKRDEIERESKRRRFRQKRNGTLLWLLLWPVGALALTAGVGMATASYDVTPMSGSFYSELWDRGYFAASGTWELEGDTLPAPANHVKITCDRADGYCLEARAELHTQGRLLGVETDIRSIVSWSDDAIVTRDGTTCHNRAMTISRASESVTALENNCSPSLQRQGREFRLVNAWRRSYESIDERVGRTRNIILVVLSAWTLLVGWRIFRLLRGRPPAWARGKM